MIMRLGSYPFPTPVYDYYGRQVNPSTPATAADCLPFQCGAQAANTNARYWCGYWGQADNLSGCTDPRCASFRPSYCAASASVPAQAAAVAAATPPASSPSSSGGPSGGGGGQTSTITPPATPTGTTIVQTPSGPVVVPTPSVATVTTTGPMTPAQVHIPNIWDSLDPSKLSQFDYRGLSISLPSWISQAFINSLQPKTASPTGVTPLDLSSIPGWVWVVILGALFLLSSSLNGKHRRRS